MAKNLWIKVCKQTTFLALINWLIWRESYCVQLSDIVCVLYFVLHADSSRDQAIIDLLAGLEDDGFCRTPARQNSQSRSLPGVTNYNCNSDEEEAGPELDKEEAELSVIMSQRWDSASSQRHVYLCMVEGKSKTISFRVCCASKCFHFLVISTSVSYTFFVSGCILNK